MAARLRRSAGVSLVEALVAMAVMTVGTLAVLGAQTTLRLNADLSKQRGEAVRIAQEQIEQARSFGDIDGYVDDIVPTPPGSPASAAGTNATFFITRLVDEDTDPNDPRMKLLRVTVSWTDRTGQDQRVQLATTIHGTPPALAGSLLLPAQSGPTSTPGGLHRGIPPGTVLIPGTTTSRFTPPGAPTGVSWVFNNLTGVISSLCTSPDPGGCSSVSRRYLGGVIRFATAEPPTLPQGAVFSPSETPQGPAAAESSLVANIGVQVVLTAPTISSAVCYASTTSDGKARAYHCAVPVDTSGAWSGRIEVTGSNLSTPPWSLATSIADTTAGRYRVCRYTPVTNCQPIVGSTIWGLPGATATCAAPSPQTTPPTPSRLMRNDDFPRNHANVTTALLNQNFLVRKAADGCPGDGPATQVNTNTWHHQPAS